jgi:hypothetical protein
MLNNGGNVGKKRGEDGVREKVISVASVLVVLFLLNLREPFFTGACFLSPCSFSSGLHLPTPPLTSVAHPSPLSSNCAPPPLPVQQSGLLDSQPCLETHRMSLLAEQTKLALGSSGMSLLHNSSEEYSREMSASPFFR